MGNTQTAQANHIELFSKQPEPVQINTSDNMQLKELLCRVYNQLYTEGQNALALFVNTYPQCMRILIQILKHPNTSQEVVSDGFKILGLLIKGPNSQEQVENFIALRAFEKASGIEFILKICNQYDFKAPGKVAMMRQALELSIQILKKDVQSVTTLVGRGFIGLLTPIIMDSRVSTMVKERMDLMRTTCQVFSEISDIQEADIMVQLISCDILQNVIAEGTGIVSNFVMILIDCRDVPTLVYALNTIANLCKIQSVHSNSYLIKNGVSAILKIFEFNQDRSIQCQVSKTLRFLCSSKNKDIADQLESQNTIDKLLKVIERETELDSSVAFYCKLCLLELCQSQENQKEIQTKDGVKHFLTLASFQNQTIQEKMLFAMTLLEFTQRASFIQINELFPYFVTVIIQYLQQTSKITSNHEIESLELNDSGLISNKDRVELLLTQKIQKISLKALRNISLNSISHSEIFTNENLRVLLPYIWRTHKYIKSMKKLIVSDAEDVFCARKGELMLTVVKALTNCLMDKEIRRNLDSYEEELYFDPNLIDDLFAFLHGYHQVADEDSPLKSYADKNKDMKRFLKELQNECTLALLMVETSAKQGDFVSQQSNENKAQFLMKVLKYDDIHMSCKSLNIMAQLASEWATVLYLHQTKIVKLCKQMIEKKQPSITREASFLLSRMLTNPENMLLWLKMDSSSACINSASSDQFLVLQQGDPKRLPKERGLYRNWGVYFSEGDILQISHYGIELNSRMWTISVWITLPLVKFQKSGRHVLVSSLCGDGVHLLVDETGSRLGCIDEESGLFIDSGNDLLQYRKGWHNITVTCNNLTDNVVTFYIDGKPTRIAQPLKCASTIRFIGNSFNGREPFGTFCDLRIYQDILPSGQILDQAKYHDELEFEMPDKYHLTFIEEGIIDVLSERMKTDIDSTVIAILQVLAKLSSKRECRAKVLQIGCFKTALNLLTFKQTSSDEYKFELQKLLFNLQ